jgi:hypothetical protein
LNKAECNRLRGYKWIPGKGCQVKPCPPCPPPPPPPPRAGVPPKAPPKTPPKAPPPRGDKKDDKTHAPKPKPKEKTDEKADTKEEEKAEEKADEKEEEKAEEKKTEEKGEDKGELKRETAPYYAFKPATHYTIPFDVTTGQPRLVTYMEYMQYYGLPAMKVYQDSISTLTVPELTRMLNEEVRGTNELRLPSVREPLPMPRYGELIESLIYYTRVPARTGIRLAPICYYLSLAKVRLIIQALLFHTPVDERAEMIEQLRGFMQAAMSHHGANVIGAPTGLYTLFISERCVTEYVPYSHYLRFFNLPSKADWYASYRRMDFNKLKGALRTLVRKINDKSMEPVEVVVRARMIAQFFHVVTGFRNARDRDLLIQWMYNNILCKPS